MIYEFGKTCELVKSVNLCVSPHINGIVKVWGCSCHPPPPLTAVLCSVLTFGEWWCHHYISNPLWVCWTNIKLKSILFKHVFILFFHSTCPVMLGRVKHLNSGMGFFTVSEGFKTFSFSVWCLYLAYLWINFRFSHTPAWQIFKAHQYSTTEKLYTLGNEEEERGLTTHFHPGLCSRFWPWLGAKVKMLVSWQHSPTVLPSASSVHHWISVMNHLSASLFSFDLHRFLFFYLNSLWTCCFFSECVLCVHTCV